MYCNLRCMRPVNLDDLAYDVFMGKYGIGETRKKLLGDLYNPVQDRVNQIQRMTNGHAEIWCDMYVRSNKNLAKKENCND